MSQGFSYFSVVLHDFILVNVATSSIMVKAVVLPLKTIVEGESYLFTV